MTTRRFLFICLVGAVIIVVTLGPAQASSSCHAIHAKGVGQDLGDGNTTARIIGGGLLHGTTAAAFVIMGGAPPVFLIAGTVEFMTNQGTLTVDVSGTFDVSTGDFSTSGPVTDATGKLAGASGSLTLEGMEDLSDGTFVENISGSICVDLSPHR